MDTSTLRPGLLVSMKTSIEGGVSYRKKIIEGAHLVESGAQRAKWETTRTITDAAEHERAVKTRSKIRNGIAGVCAASAFGLLCPESDVAKLDKAIAEGRKVAEEFNDEANVSRVNVYVITGRIAPDDAEAIRAINNEIAELINTMSEGLKKLDVKVVREAANKARAVATMLSDEAANKANEAIANARAAARKLVKAGDAAAVELDYAVIQGLQEARTAFLDVDAKAVDVVAPEAEGRALEFNGFNAAEIDAAEEADGEAEAEKPALDSTLPELELPPENVR